MALDFTLKDVVHTVTVKFARVFLPNAKKPYHLKAVFQPELDIHGIASKAAVFNIETDPKVIEEGMTAGMALIYYLAANGYRIKTPVFNLKLRAGGEYDGSETSLPEGVYPEARVQVSAGLRKYLKEKVRVVFDGSDTADGFIAEALDEATGLRDEGVTPGGLLTIRGYGLKIAADAAHRDQAGLFFTTPAGQRVGPATLAVNEPRTLKALAPAGLASGTDYRLEIVTQSPAKGGGTLLWNPREVRSEFSLTALT